MHGDNNLHQVTYATLETPESTRRRDRDSQMGASPHHPSLGKSLNGRGVRNPADARLYETLELSEYSSAGQMPSLDLTNRRDHHFIGKSLKVDRQWPRDNDTSYDMLEMPCKTPGSHPNKRNDNPRQNVPLSEKSQNLAYADSYGGDDFAYETIEIPESKNRKMKPDSQGSFTRDVPSGASWDGRGVLPDEDDDDYCLVDQIHRMQTADNSEDCEMVENALYQAMQI